MDSPICMSVGAAKRMLTGVKVMSGSMEMSQRGKLASIVYRPSIYKK